MKHKKCKHLCPLIRLFRCNRKTKSEDVEEDGATRNESVSHAPKSVASTQIVSFECWFSSLDLCDSDVIGNHIYSLRAKMENGAVKGTYQVVDTGENVLFRQSHSFMRTLQSFASKYDLAQYNGIICNTEGLPPDYGVRLNVRYVSGEKIYASDNQDNFLTREAMEELVYLFKRCLPNT